MSVPSPSADPAAEQSADPAVARWLLGADERGNPATTLPAWRTGNLVRPLVHGAAYFDRLVEEVSVLGPGDRVWFTDWRGDRDQVLRPGGPTVGELFGAAARRGVDVRGLVWRSHTDTVSMSKEENRALDEKLEADGAAVVLDQRVRAFGSHHQKFVVIRHPDDPARDVAFAGGIDLAHSRRDDDAHSGDPQALDMASIYGDTPPWHDLQVEIRGPAVADLDTTFRERWDDPTNPDKRNAPAWIRDRLAGARLDPGPLPPELPPPPPCGDHVVQTLRTYPVVRPRYEFAPRGERSIARAYLKAIRRARRLIYLEDQYLWSSEIADLLAPALRDNPDLHLVVVVPRVPLQEGPIAERPQMFGRWQAIERCRQAGGDRVHVFDLENPAGTPVYVHAKTCVIDDVWAGVGSNNLNRRSWTHDGEQCHAVLDPTPDPRQPVDPGGEGDCARVFARDLRLTLAREHLDLPADGSGDDELRDPEAFVAAFDRSAAELDAWHAGGCVGPRPPGRLRVHRVTPPTWVTRPWVAAVYRLFVDPDGRGLRMRLRNRF